MLGLRPTWCKSFAYRSRAVIERRAVLREFGMEFDESATIQVWDSSAQQRFLVHPQRPAGTVNLSEKVLATLVTRETMIGIAVVSATRPARPPESSVVRVGEGADVG